MRLHTLSVVTALALFTACGPGPQDRTAGDDGDTALRGSPHDKRGGMRVTWFRTPTGDVAVPDDFTTTPVEAFTVSGTQLVPAQVTYVGQGAFTINAELDELLYVKFGNTYLITREPLVDLSTYRIGRVDAESTEGAVRAAQLSLSNLASWNYASRLDVTSPEVGEYGMLVPDQTPLETDTSVSGSSTYESVLDRAIDASKGDTAWVTQFGYEEDPAFGFYGFIQRFAHFQDLTLAPGSNPTVSATLQVPPQETLTFDWRVSQFSARASEIHPQATYEQAPLGIYSVVGGLDKGWVGYSADLLNYFPWPSGDLSGSLAYGDPFPSSWGRLVSAQVAFKVPHLLPGTTQTLTYGQITVETSVSDFESGPVELLLSPPTSLQIDGQNGYANGTLTSATPTISWSPPAVGTPEGYIADVSELVASNGRTRPRRVASFVTKETSFVLPASILSPGKVYVVTVTALIDKGPFDPGHAPLYERGLGTFAMTVSGMLTAP